MALVLLHDFLYGKGIQCGGPLKYCVLRHKEDLRCSLEALRQEEGKQLCVGKFCCMLYRRCLASALYCVYVVSQLLSCCLIHCIHVLYI